MAQNFYLFHIKSAEKSESYSIGIIQNNTDFIDHYDLNNLPEIYKQIMQNVAKIYDISVENWNHLIYHSTIKSFDFENDPELKYYLEHPFSQYYSVF